WLEKLRSAPLFAFDTRIDGNDVQQAQLVGLAFSVAAGEPAYIPLAPTSMGVPAQLERETVLAALKPLLEDASRPKVAHQGKYDINTLARYGIQVQGLAFDVMLESYVLDSVASRHSLEGLALKHLDLQCLRLEDIAGKGVRQLSFDQIALDQAGPLAAEEAELTLRLHSCLWQQLQAVPSLAAVLNDIEMPLVPVLARIERQGALVDARLLGEQSRELGERMVALEREAFAIAGEEFN